MTIATTNLGIATEARDLRDYPTKQQPSTDTMYIVAVDEEDEEEVEEDDSEDWDENEDDQDWDDDDDDWDDGDDDWDDEEDEEEEDEAEA